MLSRVRRVRHEFLRMHRLIRLGLICFSESVLWTVCGRGTDCMCSLDRLWLGFGLSMRGQESLVESELNTNCPWLRVGPSVVFCRTVRDINTDCPCLVCSFVQVLCSFGSLIRASAS